ncbi:MAG: hypothetical protein AB8B72_01540 [Crocinitomicaceae bacterium]
MGWLSFIVILFLSVWLVWRYYGAKGLFQRDLVFGLLVKFAFAGIYLLLFIFYFSDGSLTGDTARFFSEGEIISRILWQSPSDFFRLLLGMPLVNDHAISLLNETNLWAPGTSTAFLNDNKLILKLNAILHLVSFGNVYVHGLVFSFLSFSGIYFSYKTFAQWVNRKKLFWWVLIAFPNLAFWGSGLLKESLFILGFGLWVWSVLKISEKQYRYIFLILIGGGLLIFNKPYAGVVLIGFTVLFLMGHFLSWSKKGLIAISAITIGILLFSIFTPGKMSLTDRLSNKQFDFDNLARGGIAFTNDSAFCVFPYQQLQQFKPNGDSIKVTATSQGQYKLFGTSVYKPITISPSEKAYPVYLIYQPSGSYTKTQLINHSPSQLLKNSGTSLTNVFLRPFPTDGGDSLKNLSFLSNLLLFALLFYAITYRRLTQGVENYIMWALIVSALIIALIIGWSIPVFGAIVRYKIPVELLLIIFSFIILKPIKDAKV